MLCHRAEMLPIECIVRGYLSGSAWKEYRTAGPCTALPLPAGMQESEQLPEPVFTPSTKAETASTTRTSTSSERSIIVGRETAERARDIGLELYRRARRWAADRGIMIADTKFELGFIDGELAHLRRGAHAGLVAVLACGRVDARARRRRASTSSRCATSSTHSDWDKKPPPPALPDEVIAASRAPATSRPTRRHHRAVRSTTWPGR